MQIIFDDLHFTFNNFGIKNFLGGFSGVDEAGIISHSFDVHENLSCCAKLTANILEEINVTHFRYRTKTAHALIRKKGRPTNKGKPPRLFTRPTSKPSIP
jgi:hypothetical protein